MTKDRKLKRYRFDERSYGLAKYFLGDDRPEAIYRDLAQQIQDCVEDFCSTLENAERLAQEARVRLTELARESDEKDAMIMLWAKRNPRVCASNAPTGEHINYGGRAQS